MILKKDVGKPCFWKLIQLAFLAEVAVAVCAFVLVLRPFLRSFDCIFYILFINGVSGLLSTTFSLSLSLTCSSP